MTDSPLQTAAALHKALGHPARIRTAAMLRSGELCVCQITAVLRLAPSTVSAHLAELRQAGIVTERKAGRWVHYALSSGQAARRLLDATWSALATDARVERDGRMVQALRRIPVERLCRPEFDADSLDAACAAPARSEER